jgi:hypothetical protein
MKFPRNFATKVTFNNLFSCYTGGHVQSETGCYKTLDI